MQFTIVFGILYLELSTYTIVDCNWNIVFKYFTFTILYFEYCTWNEIERNNTLKNTHKSA